MLRSTSPNGDDLMPAANRIAIVCTLLAVASTAPVLVGQSTPSDPWREFPPYDNAIASRLRKAADAKEVVRLLAEAPASVDIFKKLVRATRLDDALVVLKRVFDAAEI